MIQVNLLAVLVSAIASMVVGALWYSPALFGNQWASMMGWDKSKMAQMKKAATKGYIVNFITSLIAAYVLGYFVQVVQATTVLEGVYTGFWIWLGFIATTSIGSYLWEGKPFKFYLINSVFQLVAFAVMAAILTVWV